MSPCVLMYRSSWTLEQWLLKNWAAFSQGVRFYASSVDSLGSDRLRIMLRRHFKNYYSPSVRVHLCTPVLFCVFACLYHFGRPPVKGAFANRFCLSYMCSCSPTMEAGIFAWSANARHVQVSSHGLLPESVS